MIAQTIQLALAPVFLLVAIGNIMNILSARLGRIVDRSRALQQQHGATAGPEHDLVVSEIRAIDRRIALVGRSIALLVVSGLTIGTTVAILFVEEIAGISLQQLAAGTFLIAIALLMWALLLFLRETQLSTASLRIPRDYMDL
jgi:Protein of unknown function (DUF2721)